MEIIIIFFITHCYLLLYSQSFLQHRYASHGSFTMNKFRERIFYIYAYITQGSSYMSAQTYGILYRIHHSYANTPFEVNNTSRNFIPVDFLMLGEDYHNNHHKFPSSVNFGYKWYEIDPLYYIMLGLESLHILKIRHKGKYIAGEY